LSSKKFSENFRPRPDARSQTAGYWLLECVAHGWARGRVKGAEKSVETPVGGAEKPVEHGGHAGREGSDRNLLALEDNLMEERA